MMFWMEHRPEEFRGLGPPLRPEATGQRADAYLAKSFPFYSRQQWKQLCNDSRLLVNGKPVRASHRLKGGDQLMVFHPLASEPEVDEGIHLLAEDHGIIAVYKPGNLPMHESGLYRRRTFVALLQSNFGPEWAPVHRLDRETSGVVICAGSSQLRHKLSRDFTQQRIKKRYLAIVAGDPVWDEIAFSGPLRVATIESRPMLQVSESGMPAETVFKVLARTPQAALLEVEPLTGRTNQIRVHAAELGHYLIGDKIYHRNPDVIRHYARQGDCAYVQKLTGFKRHALHSAKITLHHPELNRDFSAVAPLPDDLQGLWAKLCSADAKAEYISPENEVETRDGEGFRCRV